MSRTGNWLAAAFCLMAIVIAQAMGYAARAQPYPSRVIRMIVPFPAGGIADLVARQVSLQIQNETGQSIVVDNRPGAGGNIGLDAVAKSTPRWLHHRPRRGRQPRHQSFHVQNHAL